MSNEIVNIPFKNFFKIIVFDPWRACKRIKLEVKFLYLVVIPDLFFSEEKIPEVGTKLKYYPTISYLWHLEFEVKSVGPQGPNYSNLIHITNGDNYGSFGSRYPAVFVKQAKGLIFFISLIFF